jgi:translocation and assembly module TamB
MPANEPDPTPPAARQPRKRRTPWLTSLTLILVPAIALIAALWAGSVWLTSTTGGLRTLAWTAKWFVPSLQTDGLAGSINEGFTADRISVDEPSWSMSATALVVTPAEIRWRARAVDLATLSARTVTVQWNEEQDKASTPPEPPQSLALPLDLRLRDATIGELRFGARGDEPLLVRDLRLQAEADKRTIRIERASARYGATEAVLNGTIETTRPFPLAARADIRSTLLERPLQAAVEATGSLLETTVSARSESDSARLHAVAQLTPFAPVPLAALSLDVADFELAPWVEGAPGMRLTGSAELQPASGARGFELAGPFKVSNALAGPVDRERVPVEAARGTLRWSEEALDIRIDRLDAAGGSARGEMTRSADGSLAVKAAFSNVDAARIHTALTPTRANGAIDYRLDGAVQRFTGNAINTDGLPLAVEFDLALADKVLDIRTGVARIGDGRANVRGRIALTGNQAAQLAGEFEALDLSRFIEGVETRLNGRLSVDGTLSPVRRGQAQVELSNSRLYGRPIEGRADLRLDDQLLDVDTDVRSGAARLLAKGGLGAGRELTFQLSVPNLAALEPSLAGAIDARGTVSGSLDSPAIVANLSAAELVLPNKHRVSKAEASVRASTTPTAPLDVSLRLDGHRAPDRPETSLASATFVARGTTAAHRIEMDATTGTAQPLSLRATGGWSDNAWRGTVATATAGKPLDLRLDAPAAALISADLISLGPTSFTARDTQFTEVELTRGNGRWQSTGSFAHLQPQAFDPRARAPRRAVRTTAADPQPLTLAGRWSLELADAVNGIVVIERTGGDLYGGVDAVHPIGISDIGAALNIVDNRVSGTAYLRGRALGRVDAVIDAYIDPDQLGLAQRRRLSIDVDAELPDLGWIGPLIGDQVQVQGAGAIRMTVGGTPADPTADGTVTGKDLRLVWIEHGLRLENGVLNAALEDGVLVINEMTFTGDSRVAPDERRALAALKAETPGSVRVVGRVALQTLTGSIGIRADRLPILQRRDRWMVVSGDGGITLTPSRAELYARPVVDGAYIDFSALRGPRALPNDVVVVRREAAGTQKKDAAPPLDVFVDVNASLGQRFYFRGAGLEARLAGGVAVKGRPSQLQAVGTVRIVDGIYNGYGQRLQIERGYVTFNGPLENPALNVLAVRAGLPVEVGVQITGTALGPVVRLHSDTAMPDVEKLNWLVLGRPPGAGDGQERALLTAAASALFAGQSGGAGSNLLRSLGIDEFGIRSGQSATSLLPRESVAGTLRSGTSSTAASDFVALGKRINDDLYVTFEQAISGAEYWVALNYQLTRRISVIARAGSTSAIDLVYSLTFD